MRCLAGFANRQNIRRNHFDNTLHIEKTRQIEKHTCTTNTETLKVACSTAEASGGNR